MDNEHIFCHFSRCKTITHCVTIKTYLAHRRAGQCVNCFVTLSRSMHFSGNWHVYTTNIGWECTTEAWIYCFSSTLLHALLLFNFPFILFFSLSAFAPLSFAHVRCPLSFQLSHFESTRHCDAEHFCAFHALKIGKLLELYIICSFIQNGVFVYECFCIEPKRRSVSFVVALGVNDLFEGDFNGVLIWVATVKYTVICVRWLMMNWFRNDAF